MLSQFANGSTNSMRSNRIYTIILIRHSENQVPITWFSLFMAY